jgi:type I restriction enzyme S subunit
LHNLSIPVPPVKEQRRIVGRIDELTLRAEELKKLIDDAKADLAAFTPALLAKAFRGEL